MSFQSDIAAATGYRDKFAGEPFVVDGIRCMGTAASDSSMLDLLAGGPEGQSEILISISRTYLPRRPVEQAPVRARNKDWRIEKVEPRPGTWRLTLKDADS